MFWHVSVLPQICLSTGGGGQSSVQPGGGGAQSSVQPGGGVSGPARRGGQVQPEGGSGPAGGGSGPARGVRSSQGGQVQPEGSGPAGGGSGPGSWGGGSAKIGQQKEYSLHGGRYASCVHAGGLSCYKLQLHALAYSGNKTSYTVRS